MNLLASSTLIKSDSANRGSLKTQLRKGATRSGNSARQVRVSRVLVKRTLAMFAVCVLVVSGFGLYKAMPYLNPSIEHISVTGEMVRLDKATLSRAVYANLKGGILTLDIEYLRSEISRIAWVEQVEIVKYFPSTLSVHIVEERAVARWNDQGYISNAGEFIESAIYEDLAGLPLLTSSMEGIAPEQAAREAVGIFHMLNSTVLMYDQNIQELKQSSKGGWIMIWDNGLSIDLGRVDHLNRIRHAMAAWQRLPGDVKNNIDRIDARYENGVAIRSRQDLEAVALNQIDS